MFLALYLLSTGAAAGLVGVTGRRLLASLGFIPDFETGVIVAAGIAAAYIAAQALYMCVAQLIAPTRSGGPLLAEALASAAAIVLIPYLLAWPLPQPVLAAIPDGNMEELALKVIDKAGVLVFGGLFLGLHAALKLFSFFWTLQAAPTSRLILIPWAGLAAAGLFGTATALDAWRAALESARVAAPSEEAPYRIGTTYATARALPEGALLTVPFPYTEVRQITLRLANPPGTQRPLELVNVLVEPDSADGKPFAAELTLDPGGWVTLQIPPGRIPKDVQQLTISWTVAQDPVWLVQAGLRPVVRSGRKLLVSGPYIHRPSKPGTGSHIVVLLLEGVGTDRLHTFGYERETSPSLDAFAEGATVFSQLFTASPEVPATAMTLLTGLSPLRHGYLGERQGPLPEGIRTLPELLREAGYMTAAFTEGDGLDVNDLTYGSGFERGFELFDHNFALEPSVQSSGSATPSPLVPKGSFITLDKAGDFLEQNRDASLFLFVRLRELRTPQALARYGTGFIQNRRDPRPIEVYDTALRALDEQIGAFIERLAKTIGRENTYLFVTSAYGYRFAPEWRAQPERGLAEESLRVPLLIAEPGRTGRQRSTLLGMEDAAAALFGLAQLDSAKKLPYNLDGRNALTVTTGREPISVYGDPLQFSLRTRRWRFTWDSGIAAETLSRVRAEAPLALVDLEALRRQLPQGNPLRDQARILQVYRDRLASVLGDAIRERGSDLDPALQAGSTEPDPSAPAL